MSYYVTYDAATGFILARRFTSVTIPLGGTRELTVAEYLSQPEIYKKVDVANPAGTLLDLTAEEIAARLPEPDPWIARARELYRLAADALVDIDAYLAIADGATGEQVRTEVKKIDIRLKYLIEAMMAVCRKLR